MKGKRRPTLFDFVPQAPAAFRGGNGGGGKAVKRRRGEARRRKRSTSRALSAVSGFPIDGKADGRVLVLLPNGEVTEAVPQLSTKPCTYLYCEGSGDAAEAIVRRFKKCIRSVEDVSLMHPILSRATGRPLRLKRLYFESPSCISALKSYLSESNPADCVLYEADVRYVRRLFAHAISAYCRLACNVGEQFEEQFERLLRESVPVPNAYVFDIEVANDRSFPFPFNSEESMRKAFAKLSEGNVEEAAEVVRRDGGAGFKVISVSQCVREGGKCHWVLHVLRERVDANIGELSVEDERFRVVVHDSEEELLRSVVTALKTSKVWVTYNGSNFDVPYIIARALRIGSPELLRALKGLEVEVIESGESFLVAPKSGLHVDLFKWFSNSSIKTYAYGKKYDKNALEDVASALLGMHKVNVRERGLTPGELSGSELMRYSATDAVITERLFELAWPLMVLMLKIARMPLSLLLVTGISTWVLQTLMAFINSNGYVLPNEDEVTPQAYTADLSETGKKYIGAYVRTPPKGVYERVADLDFASLYPTTIVQYNVSFDTVFDLPERYERDRSVPERVRSAVLTILRNCRRKEYVRRPDSGEPIHVICMDWEGLVPRLLRLLRDFRLKYKRLAKGGDESANQVQMALKVFINAMYGVFGAEHFPLSSPGIAESVTILARSVTVSTIEYAERLGMNVLYSDTDSLFVVNYTDELLRELMRYAEERGFQLELDSVFRFVIFVGLKKNYIAVKENGEVVIKGAVGKKSNVPPAIREVFKQFVSELRKARTKEEVLRVIERAKEAKDELLKRLGELEPKQLAFSATLTKDPDEYTAQQEHVKAARRLIAAGIPVKKGDKIEYVVTKNGPIPLELVRGRKVIYDIDKYRGVIETVFGQVLSLIEKRGDGNLLRYMKAEKEEGEKGGPSDERGALRDSGGGSGVTGGKRGGERPAS